jgi:transposase-like protein
MIDGNARRRRQLTPEEKWQVFVEVCSQQLTQADAARKWGVDVSTVIKIRRLAKDGALGRRSVLRVFHNKVCAGGRRTLLAWSGLRRRRSMTRVVSRALSS